MYVFSKAYVKHTEQLLKIRNDFKDKFIEVKYEDIIANPKDEIKEILDYCEIVYSEIEFQNAVNAKVVGSSFFGSNQHIQNWGKLNKTEDFNSVGRYKSWNWFNKLVFNIVASKSNNLAGYNHKL
jgi:c-di-GMP-related signal transduction protein